MLLDFKLTGIENPFSQGQDSSAKFEGWPIFITINVIVSSPERNYIVGDTNAVALLHALSATFYRSAMMAGSTKIIFEGGPEVLIDFSGPSRQLRVMLVDACYPDLRYEFEVGLAELGDWVQRLLDLIRSALNAENLALGCINRLGLTEGRVDRSETNVFHVYW
ncbi:hypothetical protein [Maricaulis sp.]|uniref:hypothetical protein n=1 Tax=Maricaulis sp. TaxID=1486257 RepID=UPI00260A8466|nr:hypothetical protein [Maricaulis sp.]